MTGNVFISWSKPKSKSVAEAFRDWLPSVIQAVKPWLSSHDINKGARWSREIAGQLKDAKVGIVCLTPENLDAPWLNFEAGALSKTVEDAFVCPYLFGVEPAQVKGPLSQFQLTKAEKQDTRQLLGTINKALGETGLTEPQLDRVFEKWWPEIEEKLRAIPDREIAAPQRPDREILEEILSIVRSQARRQKSQLFREPLFGPPTPARFGREWPISAGLGGFFQNSQDMAVDTALQVIASALKERKWPQLATAIADIEAPGQDNDTASESSGAVSEKKE